MVRLKVNGNRTYEELTTFQFLMVRLKASGETNSGNCILISIPYGSIKSAPAIRFKAVNVKFQFLMVRLKVHVVNVMLVFQIAFQFLMVRLKVVNFPVGQNTIMVFQFLMVRLKD